MVMIALTGPAGDDRVSGMTTHDHTSPLPTDAYYRGYRLSWCRGQVHIYSGPELIDTMSTQDGDPKKIIDSWLNAR